MDIKKAVEYAQVSLKKLQEENKINNKQLTAKQLGETMWRIYYMYDNEQIHSMATEIINNLELQSGVEC